MVRRNDVDIRAVPGDFILRNRRRQSIFIPIETHALGDSKLIEHRLVRHASPADGEIHRNESRLPIPTIALRMEKTRVDGKTREWFQSEVSMLNRILVKHSGLLRVGCNQDAGRINDRRVEMSIA